MVISRKILQLHLLFTAVILLNVNGISQEINELKSAESDTTKNVRIKVDHSDVAHLIKDDNGDLQILIGQVELRQDSIYMYCDSATIVRNNVNAVGHVIIQDRESISAFGEYLFYDGNTRIARLEEDVKFANNERKLFTPNLIYNLNTKVARYNNGGILFDGDLQLKSKRGSYHAHSSNAFFKDSVTIIHKDFELKSDSIRYDYENKKVFFLGKTLIFQEGANIYCEDGFYLIDDGIAEFSKNAQYKSEDRQATAEKILYNRQDGVVTLIGHAEIKQNEKLASADTIIYLEKTKKSDLLGNAFFDDGVSVIYSPRILHDGLTNAVNTKGKTIVRGGDNYLESNQLDYDDETGLGIAVGEVIWQDTAQGVTIFSDIAEYTKREKRVKAYGSSKPLMINRMENDSMFLSADTLLTFQYIHYDTIFQSGESEVRPSRDSTLSIDKDSLSLKFFLTPLDSLTADSADLKLIKPNAKPRVIVETRIDTTQRVLAYSDVKIYKSDFQAVCDSLSYDTRDSIFRFYKNPLIWSDTTQLSGDTIYVYTKDNQIESAQLIQNGFIITSQDLVYYDQIKGRDVWSYFEDGDLDKVKVKGNAESYYYVLDDNDAFIGLNKSICSEIIVHFEGQNKIHHIDFLKKPNFNFLPMKDVMAISPKLEGFQWNLSKRPKSVSDLTNKVRIEEVPIKKKLIKRNLKE